MLKIIIMTFGLCLFSSASFAASEDGCIKGDCNNGKGVYKAAVGVYRGNFKNGSYNGQGKFTYDNDGATYEGEWKNGMREGYGVFIASNGDIYEGKWENNKLEGHAERIVKKSVFFRDIIIYIGDYINGKEKINCALDTGKKILECVEKYKGLGLGPLSIFGVFVCILIGVGVVIWWKYRK